MVQGYWASVLGHRPSPVDREGEVDPQRGTGTETSTPQSLRCGLRSQSPFDAPRLIRHPSSLSPSRERRAGSKIFLDPEESVVLREPLGTRHGADLDLPGSRGHGQVGDGCILGLSRSR